MLGHMLLQPSLMHPIARLSKSNTIFGPNFGTPRGPHLPLLVRFADM